MYDMGPIALLPLRRKCMIRIFITHKNSLSLAEPEPATESPMGPTASMLTTRPLRAALWLYIQHENVSGNYIQHGAQNETNNQQKTSPKGGRTGIQNVFLFQAF
jgi:hypothetical protein